MHPCRSILVLLALASFTRGAELRTLKGEVIKGNLVSVSEKEVVVSSDGNKVTTPVDQVMHIKLAEDKPLAADAAYRAVELNDGSVFLVKQFVLKGKRAELPLLGGQTVKVPLSSIANVLIPAQEKEARENWAKRVATKRLSDVAVARAVDKNTGKTRIASLEGVLGEGDDDGETISITTDSGTRKLKIGGLYGLIFFRKPDQNAAPVVCRVHDKDQNVVMASSVVSTAAGMTVQTPSGAKVEYPNDALTLLDYSQGKIVFLSDLTPAKVIETETGKDHWQRDKNLDFGPIVVNGIEYAKGLALHAHTELEYDLKGDYREFRAVIGIDDNVQGFNGVTTLRIEGDGTEIVSLRFDRRDKERHQTVIRDVRNVQKLRIIVSSDHLFHLGRHLDLAEARVVK